MYETLIPVLAVILALIVGDYITGILAAVINGDFSSTKMRQGLIHKSAYVFALALAFCAEWAGNYIDLGFEFEGQITVLVSAWVIITEMGSILENIIKLNPELANSPLGRIFSYKEIGGNDNDDEDI